MDALEEKKKQLRRQMKALRDAISEAERERARVLITERILGHQWFYGANRVLAFMPFGSEIDITEILQETIRQGKDLYLPRTEGAQIRFYRVRDLKDLVPGTYGILEPPAPADEGESLYRYDPGEEALRGDARFPELCIMPGLAFDVTKARLGYGGGYYDRFLADKFLLSLQSIAVGFACQQVPELLPVLPSDVRPGQVILV